MAAPNPERQRQARQRLAELFAHPPSVYVLHYACESFAQNGLSSPRVTALAARNLASGDVKTFSIHAEAVERNLAPVQVLTRYDELEQAMLEKVFAFLDGARAMRFVTWNMRDAVFGFEAIARRGARLGLVPTEVAEHNRIDLAQMLVAIHGSGYVDSPYLEKLAEKNGLARAGILGGADEAQAFARGDYSGVERSVLAKVRLIYDVLHLAHDRTLKTNASFWTMNAGGLREAAELFRDNPVKAWAGVFVAVLTGSFWIVKSFLG